MSQTPSQKLISAAVILLLARCFHGVAFADPSPAAVVAILDGDRVDVSYHFTQEAVSLRLYGVDAPEEGQHYWQEAKDFLASLLDGERIRVGFERNFRQSDGRQLATVFLPDGSTANQALIKAGMAWAFKEDFEDVWLGRTQELSVFEELKILEEEAREAKRGLWADPDPLPPWLYRRLRSGAYP